MFSWSWSCACSQEGQSLLPRGIPVLSGGIPGPTPGPWDICSPHLWPHMGPHVPVSKMTPLPAMSPALHTDKGLLCPCHADKYRNSIFIGCINICLYIHFIHHSAGPEGRAQGEAPAAQQLPLSPKPYPLCANQGHQLLLPLPPRRRHCMRRRSGVKGVGNRRAWSGKTHVSARIKH